MKTKKQLLRELAQEREQSRQLRDDASKRELEQAALLAASRSVSEFRTFRESARVIFDIAKSLIGATSGYVALLNDDGSENEVLFLDAGGLPCTVDPSLPMPIRGLRAEVYKTGKVAYDNTFAESEWQKFMPEGHVVLNNVLFAPLTINEKVVGLIGLANKPGDFDEADARLATVFGELAAVSLSNDYTFESLERSEERFRSVWQSANDAIVSADSSGGIISWNKGATSIFGYEEEEIIGRPLTVLMPERYRSRHVEAMERYLETEVPRVIGSTVEMHGTRRDGSEFPLELSLSTWKTQDGTFFTGIIRDITNRKRREELSGALNSINAAINSTLELEEILQTAIDEAASVLNSGTALAAILEGDSMVIRHVTGLPESMIGRRLSPAEAEMLQQAAGQQAPLAINAVIADETLESLTQAGIFALLPIDLTAMEELLGVIVIGFPEAVTTFARDELDFAAKLATSVSLSVKNASLYRTELDSRGICQNYANQLTILHEVGLSLNRETDKGRLLNTVLKSAAEITNAGVGIMMQIQDGRASLASIYYAPWFLRRCTLSDGTGNLHQRVMRRLDADADVLRMSGQELFDDLPEGHMQLHGLLAGVIRDTMGRVKGLFLLSHKAGNSEFSSSDEEVISLLAAQCSVALVSAENFEREHVVAETLQDALLPEAPNRDDIDVGLLYQSSGPLGKIGGDFYDFIELEDSKIAVVVGDVCGKGLTAATYTAMIKYMLRAYLGEGMLPGDCLTRLNRNIHNQVSIEKFVTVGLSLIDLEYNTISYTAAGHPPPVICERQSPSTLFIQPAVPLGVIPDQKYLSTQVTVSRDSVLFMYTDGLTDARPADAEPFGEQRVLESVGKNCRLPAQAMAQAIIDAAVDYSGGALRDDIAIIAVRFRNDAPG